MSHKSTNKPASIGIYRVHMSRKDEYRPNPDAFRKLHAQKINIGKRYNVLNRKHKLKVIARDLMTDAVLKIWSHHKDKERYKGYYIRLVSAEWGDKLLKMPYHKAYSSPPTISDLDLQRWRDIDRQMVSGVSFLEEKEFSDFETREGLAKAVDTMSKDKEFIVCVFIFGRSDGCVLFEKLPWDKEEMFGDLPVPDHAYGDMSREFDVDTLLTTVCANCKRPESYPNSLEACARCRQVKYCSTEYLEKDRDRHEPSCFDIREMRERELRM